MKLLSSLFLTLSATFLFNCTSTKNPDQPQNSVVENTVTDQAHNSRNSLDWPGIYRGVLPCADCAGIRTELKLNQDLTYEMARLYQEKDTKVIRNTGIFQWDETGSYITLTNSDQPAFPKEYKVEENQLWQLDANGQIVSGPLAEMYALKKAGSDNLITDKYWKLIELNGRAISAPENPKREPHLTLHAENNRVSGNSGCNTFTGTFYLQEGSSIKFNPLAATRMACADINYEHELFQVFTATDNFTIRGDTLSLNRAKMAPLARFIAVYFR